MCAVMVVYVCGDGPVNMDRTSAYMSCEFLEKSSHVL